MGKENSTTEHIITILKKAEVYLSQRALGAGAPALVMNLRTELCDVEYKFQRKDLLRTGRVYSVGDYGRH